MITKFTHRPSSQIAFFNGLQPIEVGSIYDFAHEIGKKIKNIASPRTIIHIPNQDPFHFLSGLLACLQNNCIAVPTADEASSDHCLKLIIKSSEIVLQSPTHPQNNTLPPEADIILSTTGSTGKPKGVVLNFNQLLINADIAGSSIGLQPHYRWGIEIGLNLTSGLCHLLMAWLKGATVYFLANLSQEEKIDFFQHPYACLGGSPVQLLKYADWLPSSHQCHCLVSSGDFLTSAAIQKLDRAFPDSEIYKFYGLTEAAGRFCLLSDQRLRTSPEAVGEPLTGYSYTLKNLHFDLNHQREVGEVIIRSPLLMLGYWIDNHFKPNINGEFATGDLGYVGRDNLLYLVGRADDVFKVGGEKVDRHTIEQAVSCILKQHDFCVLPWPHQQLGYVPALFVEKAVHPLPSWLSILSALRKQLEPRFLPMHGFLVDHLPRKGNGKLDKTRLLQTAREYPYIS